MTITFLLSFLDRALYSEKKSRIEVLEGEQIEPKKMETTQPCEESYKFRFHCVCLLSVVRAIRLPVLGKTNPIRSATSDTAYLCVRYRKTSDSNTSSPEMILIQDNVRTNTESVQCHQFFWR